MPHRLMSTAIVFAFGWAVGFVSRHPSSSALDPKNDGHVIRIDAPSEDGTCMRNCRSIRICRTQEPDGDVTDYSVVNRAPWWTVHVPTPEGNRTYYGVEEP